MVNYMPHSSSLQIAVSVLRCLITGLGPMLRWELGTEPFRNQSHRISGRWIEQWELRHEIELR